MTTLVTDISYSWQKALQDKSFKKNFFLTLLFLAIALTSLTNFLQFNEAREGVVLHDPILSLFSPINLTWLTFLLIYGGLVTAVLGLLAHPKEMLVILQAYSIMVFVRIVLMYSLPLNPPELIIPLKDPFVELFGGGKVLEKDLFFSGHTSTMFLLFLASKNKILKAIFLVCTIVIGFTVLLQHVHYSVDVFVAPFIAYACYKIALTINN